MIYCSCRVTHPLPYGRGSVSCHYNPSRDRKDKTYRVTADFTDIGGLKVRAPVTVAGVRIGEVSRIELQPG
ncbi:MlaD family protein, partial [Legionella pneumophila]|nr:MlaD family protein [Legionella pneumophila]